MRSLSRVDNSTIARWWWSVDWLSLGLIAAIATIGVVLILAAGPVAASRLHINDDFYFTVRQMLFLAPALIVLFGVSLLSPLQARRLGVIVFIGALVLMAAALIAAPEINGARRWLDFGPFGVQPSEFAKPAFVVAAAWMLAEGARDPRFPGGAIGLGLYIVFAAMLILQPDMGQWFLVTAVWTVMFFIAGWSWLWIVLLGLAACAAFAAAYMFLPHVAQRIDGFLRPEASENFQVDRALEAIANGKLAGRAADAPAIKLDLPDAHTDFIFAVGGEEFGFLFCILIIALFAAFVARAFMLALSQRSLFVQCAVSGLAALVGLQAIINIAVNLRAIPAKGMTLPFISYGGSSLIATGLTLGLILALTRAQGPVWRRKEIMP
ncbi:MAG: FtsW/RodA/SpoVE family cell cycle protein [Parvularculaceae bacterium]